MLKTSKLFNHLKNLKRILMLREEQLKIMLKKIVMKKEDTSKLVVKLNEQTRALGAKNNK